MSTEARSAKVDAPEPIGRRIATTPAMLPKHFVYIMKSRSAPGRYYTGLTSDFPARLVAHNAGESHHTSSGRPWDRVVVIEFAKEQRAHAFERYLKSGSGVAFSKRHLR